MFAALSLVALTTLATAFVARPAHARDPGGTGARRNVYGKPLQPCCMENRTGYARDGFCRFFPTDPGSHTVCAEMTAEFLQFSRAHGNDLSTPRPEWDFPGLKPGDLWCLCAARWQQALTHGAAPKVCLDATDEAALNIVRLADLQQHARAKKGEDGP